MGRLWKITFKSHRCFLILPITFVALLLGLTSPRPASGAIQVDGDSVEIQQQAAMAAAELQPVPELGGLLVESEADLWAVTTAQGVAVVRAGTTIQLTKTLEIGTACAVVAQPGSQHADAGC